MIHFSECTNYFTPSAIRNSLFDQKDMISFSAGKPDESSFPLPLINTAVTDVLTQDSLRAFQYSDTEGFPDFREQICSFLTHIQLNPSSEQIALLSGSQQGIYFSTKLFINPGDVVLCESPTFSGALSVFHSFQARCIGVPLESDGMDMEKLETLLLTTPNVKMIYTIPDFQNPTGITMSIKKRKKLADLAAKYQIPVVEDNPYGELRYEGNMLPPVKSFDQSGYVIYLGTFSKIFCPGLRLGYVFASESIIEKFVLLKQLSDLQCSSFNELIAKNFLMHVTWSEHINHVKDIYRQRNELMYTSMQNYIPSSVSYQKPAGGFFYWLTLPESLPPAKDLLALAAKEEKVCFIPGADFFPSSEHPNCIRLSFSNVSKDKIDEGIQRLGHLLKKFL